MSLARPSTEIQAANGALSHCKQPGIALFTEDNIRARQCSIHFGAVRDAVLAEHPWSFATGWVTPARDPVDSLGPLKGRFPLPADCITVRSVDGLEEDEWTLEASDGAEAKVLVTNATAPLVCFTKRITTVKLWEPLFLEVFQYRLAAAMAPMLLGSQVAAANLANDADQKLAPAQRADKREAARSTVSRDTSWIRARR